MAPRAFFVALCSLLLTAAAPTTPAATTQAPAPQDAQQADAARAAAQKAQDTARARATSAAAEERRLADARVAAAAKLRGLENDLAVAADRVADLAKRKAAAQAELDQRNATLAPLLLVIERLGRDPAETLLASPLPTEESVTGILVLGGLTRQLAIEAAKLRDEKTQLEGLTAELDAAHADLTRRETAQAAEARVLDRQIAVARETRHAAEGEASEWARRAAAEAARAPDVGQAIAGLEAASKAAEARPNAHRGQLAPPRTPPGGIGAFTVPVAGRVTQHFGEEVNGSAATGIIYQAPPAALVVSPCAAKVVFAGAFRSFGLLTILDCGGGYLAVLSGFDQLDAQLGQSVKQGEPIGTMAAWNPSQLARRPQLNFELRRDGQPIDPIAYLRANS